MKCKRLAIAIAALVYSCSVGQKQNAPFFASVPIATYSSSQIPCLNVEIENKPFLLKLDLGFQGDATIAKESIDFIFSKTFIGEKFMYGVRGKEYKKKLYRIPKIKIGAMAFLPPILQEESREFLEDAIFLQNKEDPLPQESVGRVGWKLFYNTNLLVDIKNSQIAFCDSLDSLKKHRRAENYVKTPLFLDRGLVEFEAETPEGPLRCALDTGSTWNILNTEIEDRELETQAIRERENLLDFPLFKIEGRNFGPITFHCLPIKIPIHVEAILGMEFFKDHLIFLDFAENTVYFSNTGSAMQVGSSEPLKKSKDCLNFCLQNDN